MTPIFVLRFFSWLRSLMPGSRTYQVPGGFGFLHLNVATLRRRLDPALEGYIDAQRGMPSTNHGPTPTEVKIREAINTTCNQNRSRRNKMLQKLFVDINKHKEDIEKIFFNTRANLESKKKEFINVSGKMSKDAPDINTTFERVRVAYENLCEFRNDHRITSEKEIDLSSFRLVYPIVLSFSVLMEMLYTGFQLAPALGLGQAYGQFGGFSVLMAFLAYEGGRYYAYHQGYRKKPKPKADDTAPRVKETFYLPTVVVCLSIMLFIMGFNFLRLPSGDHALVLLWMLFCFFAFLHGISGEKYAGHRNHIVLFRKELDIFKRILYVYIDQLKGIKQKFDATVATLKEDFTTKKRLLKEGLDQVKSIERAYIVIV